jgi:hypothetical protein
VLECHIHTLKENEPSGAQTRQFNIPVLTTHKHFPRVRVTLRVAIYDQSVCLGAEPFETHGQNFCFSFEHLRSQFLCNILSDERMGLSFTIAAGLRQRSYSQVRVPRDSWPYFTVSDSRPPQPGGPGPHIYIFQEEGGSVICPVPGSLFFASYDSQDYGGGIWTRLNTGYDRLRIIVIGKLSRWGNCPGIIRNEAEKLLLQTCSP